MNNSELSEGLKTIRLTKYLTEIPLLIFGFCVIVYFALDLTGLGGWFEPVYKLSFFLALIGFLMLFFQEKIKCPYCKNKFNVKIKEGYVVRNLFSRECMNCGLMLNGKNIKEYGK